MLKSVEDLVYAWDRGRKEAKRGNHSMLVCDGYVRFMYHGNTVCYFYPKKKEYRLDDCGYKGYSSTTRTLNSYRYLFESRGCRLHAEQPLENIR